MISSDLDDFADQALSATSDISSSCSRSELAGQSRAPETAQHDMEIMINTSHASGRQNNILLPAISMINFEEFDTQLDVDRLLGQIEEAFSFQEPMFDHWADDLLDISAFCSAGNNLL
jgi:glutaredoxin 2